MAQNTQSSGGGSQTAPTLIAASSTANYTSFASSKNTSASFTWLTGDVFVVIGGNAGAGVGDSLSAPTATGLTFTSIVNHAANSDAAVIAYCATAASGGSGVITGNSNTGSSHFGITAWQYRGSNGCGTHPGSAFNGNTARTVSMTPDGGSHSAVVWGVFDWAAAAVQSATPSPTTTQVAAKDGTEYTAYTFNLNDQPTSGATSYGIGGTGTGPFSIVAIEVKGH